MLCMVIWLVLTFQIGQVSDVLKTQGAQLILPVVFLHAAAFALGYWLSKVSFGESTSRTISIECGMQVNPFFIPKYVICFLLFNCLSGLSTFLTSLKFMNHSSFQFMMYVAFGDYILCHLELVSSLTEIHSFVRCIHQWAAIRFWCKSYLFLMLI